jgi:hypothetical protein
MRIIINLQNLISLWYYARRRLKDYLKKEFLNWLTLKIYYKVIEYLTLDLLIKLRTLVLIKPLRSQD